MIAVVVVVVVVVEPREREREREREERRGEETVLISTVLPLVSHIIVGSLFSPTGPVHLHSTNKFR